MHSSLMVVLFHSPPSSMRVSLSITKSEYIAATHGMKEVLWLCSLLSEVFGTITMPTTLFLNNQAAITLTHDHQCTKHIDV